MLHTLSHDWLPMRSSVAGAAFMNEFAPDVMQAPLLMRHTRQRFIVIEYNKYFETSPPIRKDVKVEPYKSHP